MLLSLIRTNLVFGSSHTIHARRLTCGAEPVRRSQVLETGPWFWGSNPGSSAWREIRESYMTCCWESPMVSSGCVASIDNGLRISFWAWQYIEDMYKYSSVEQSFQHLHFQPSMTSKLRMTYRKCAPLPYRLRRRMSLAISGWRYDVLPSHDSWDFRGMYTP